MKKVLLLSAAVCMAITMSAQKLTAEKATLSLDKTLATPTFSKTYAQSVINKTVAPKKAPKKVVMPSFDSLTGLYVCDNTNPGDGTKTFTQSKAIEIEYLENGYTLDPVFEGDPTTECNVLVRNFITEGTEVYGIYDQADGTLTLPFQLALQANYDYYFVNCVSMDELEQVTMEYGKPFVLTLAQDANGWYFLNETDDLGFALVVFNEESEQLTPIGFGGTCFYDVAVTPCNYICDGEWFNTLQQGADWEERDAYGVFLEPIGESTIAIHGFMGYSTVYAELDEEGKVGRIETLQPLLYERINEAGDYDYISVIKWGLDGKENIKADYTIPYIGCGWYTITYSDKEGNVTGEESGFGLIDDETKNWEYYSPGRDGQVGGYAPLITQTFFKAIENPALTPEAIQNAVITPASNPLFNLAGQRVNKNAKGLVIENGKKIVK